MIIVCTHDDCRVMPPALTMRLRAGMPSGYRFVDPLAVPAEQDLIDLFVFAAPDARWPKGIKRVDRAAVAWIGDDLGGPFGQGGASAWRCARGLRDWARHVVIHGAGGQPEHYALVVQIARKVGRAAIIETTTANMDGWMAAMGTTRKLLILPREGVHPIEQVLQ